VKGWTVVILTHGKWTNSWDGQIHLEKADAEKELKNASGPYEARLATVEWNEES
jgi:hypothetical protein